MAPILTIFGPNRSRRRDLFFEKFSNERRHHRGIIVVVIVAVVDVVERFWVASITGPLLITPQGYALAFSTVRKDYFVTWWSTVWHASPE